MVRSCALAPALVNTTQLQTWFNLKVAQSWYISVRL
jgi:hypothetical protein